MSYFRPRPGQAELLAYTQGKMGVSAAPGSGKTEALAHLAGKLIAEVIAEGEEVLVVTLVNSAVEGLRRRINQAILERGRRLPPGLGYRVRTLHGLGHDIVRERPGLAGLAEDFGIADELEAADILHSAVDAWLADQPGYAEPFLSVGLSDRELTAVTRWHWPRLAYTLSEAYISRAKDLAMKPEELLKRLDRWQSGLGGPASRALLLARMGAEIYADYQHRLAGRGLVDFDDLVRFALEALEQDGNYLARLQARWPYILEDEAQDSSQIQERILRLLAGSRGNWVRVGDTNQAIYKTFTTADPRLLRGFLEEPGVECVTFEQSGRSQAAIMDLANRLIDWSLDAHPEPSVRGEQGPGRSERRHGAFARMHIRPTAAGDPQQNPPPDPAGVCIVTQACTPREEIAAVTGSLRRWYLTQRSQPEERRDTCAVLAPRSEHAGRLVESLRQQRIPYIELLGTTSSTRNSIEELRQVLSCLADPTSARKLASACRVWAGSAEDGMLSLRTVQAAARRIEACPGVEVYLWPEAGPGWLSGLTPPPATDELRLLGAFREVACRWHRAAALPAGQLTLAVAGDLFREPAQLALAHKVAAVLRDLCEAHPSYRLPELVEELDLVAQNRRRFVGLADEDLGFEPPRGVVTVTTMHKSKGLEWDRVYLMSVNDFDFPSGRSGETYQDEKWFVRGGLNLHAEALRHLEVLGHCQEDYLPRLPEEGEPTRQARLDYISERLRLLYVGITRAKRKLTISWNSGMRKDQRLRAALPLDELSTYWAARLKEPGGHG